MCLRVRTDLRTLLGTDGLTEWDDTWWEWRGFGPCLWGSAQHLSPRFGVWMGVWTFAPCGSCQGKSVSRSQALWGRQLWAGGQKGKRKKKSKVQRWPGLSPSLCYPADQPWAGMGEKWPHPHSEFIHQLSPAISPNSKIRKPPAPVPAFLVLCACAPSCL